MKAIETAYRGYRFRSRLEARWGVFFDAIGIDWEYEPEGYDLGRAGWYLPDFWLPELGFWVEVKPLNGSSDDAVKKLCSLVEYDESKAILVEGEPASMVIDYENPYDHPSSKDWTGYARIEVGYDIEGSDIIKKGGVSDCPHIFCVCPVCGKAGISFDGRGARVCGWKAHANSYEEYGDILKENGYGGHPDKAYSHDHPKIIKGAIKARSARFEHGETPC